MSSGAFSITNDALASVRSGRVIRDAEDLDEVVENDELVTLRVRDAAGRVWDLTGYVESA